MLRLNSAQHDLQHRVQSRVEETDDARKANPKSFACSISSLKDSAQTIAASELLAFAEVNVSATQTRHSEFEHAINRFELNYRLIVFCALSIPLGVLYFGVTSPGWASIPAVLTFSVVTTAFLLRRRVRKGCKEDKKINTIYRGSSLDWFLSFENDEAIVPPWFLDFICFANLLMCGLFVAFTVTYGEAPSRICEWLNNCKTLLKDPNAVFVAGQLTMLGALYSACNGIAALTLAWEVKPDALKQLQHEHNFFLSLFPFLRRELGDCVLPRRRFSKKEQLLFLLLASLCATIPLFCPINIDAPLLDGFSGRVGFTGWAFASISYPVCTVCFYVLIHAIAGVYFQFRRLLLFVTPLTSPTLLANFPLHKEGFLELKNKESGCFLHGNVMHIDLWHALRKYLVTRRMEMSLQLGSWGIATMLLGSFTLSVIVLLAVFTQGRGLKVLLLQPVIGSLISSCFMGVVILLALMQSVAIFKAQSWHAQLLLHTKLELSASERFQVQNDASKHGARATLSYLTDLISLFQHDPPPRIMGIPVRPTFLRLVGGYVASAFLAILGKILFDEL